MCLQWQHLKPKTRLNSRLQPPTASSHKILLSLKSVFSEERQRVPSWRAENFFFPLLMNGFHFFAPPWIHDCLHSRCTEAPLTPKHLTFWMTCWCILFFFFCVHANTLNWSRCTTTLDRKKKPLLLWKCLRVGAQGQKGTLTSFSKHLSAPTLL